MVTAPLLIAAAMIAKYAIRTMMPTTRPMYPMIRPAMARPRPCSPVFLIWLSAMWPVMMPTIEMKNDDTSETIASTLVFCVAGAEAYAGERQPPAMQGFNREESMVDGSEGGAGDKDHRKVQLRCKVDDIVGVGQGHEQATGAFDHH